MRANEVVAEAGSLSAEGWSWHKPFGALQDSVEDGLRNTDEFVRRVALLQFIESSVRLPRKRGELGKVFTLRIREFRIWLGLPTQTSQGNDSTLLSAATSRTTFPATYHRP